MLRLQLNNEINVERVRGKNDADTARLVRHPVRCGAQLAMLQLLLHDTRKVRPAGSLRITARPLAYRLL